MISQVARFVALLVVVMGAATAAEIASKAHVVDAVIELKSDAVLWGNFTIVSVPLSRAPAVYNITVPHGVVRVTYLPAGSQVYVVDGWIIGLYRFK